VRGWGKCMHQKPEDCDWKTNDEGDPNTGLGSFLVGWDEHCLEHQLVESRDEMTRSHHTECGMRRDTGHEAVKP